MNSDTPLSTENIYCCKCFEEELPVLFDEKLKKWGIRVRLGYYKVIDYCPCCGTKLK